MTNPITPNGLAEQWRELGEGLDNDDAEDLVRRLERDQVAELYAWTPGNERRSKASSRDTPRGQAENRKNGQA